MNFLSLFSGISGFDLGLESAGMTCVGQVEINPYCRKVLKKHWPNVKRMEDIFNVTGNEFGSVDLVCGGFPCQPFSVAGKRRGMEDDRAIWPEMLRIIQACQPSWVIAENVGGLLTIDEGMVFEQMCVDLETSGYEVQPFIIPACAVNSWHRRDRVWIISHSKSSGTGINQGGFRTVTLGSGGRKESEKITSNPGRIGQKECKEQTEGIEQCCEDDSNPTNERLQRSIKAVSKERAQPYDEQLHGCRREWDRNWTEVATRLCGVAYGVSNRIHRLKALGNAVVPQIVEIIGRYIIQCELSTQQTKEV